MIEPLLRRLLEHKQRKWIVIILTILTGLLVVLPAADEYNAATGRLATAKKTIEETQNEVAGLPQLEKAFREKSAQLEKLESQVVTDQVAQQLRNDLAELVRQTGCQMRQIRLAQPARRDWTTKDDPLLGTSAADRGADTPYRLETRQLTLSITGAMANLQDLMSRIHKIEKFIHTKSFALKRSTESENMTILEMDLLLLNLVKKADA
jgi:Tfp pilus assembly protein PilO